MLIAYFLCAVPLALAGVFVGGRKLFLSKERLAASRGPIAESARQPTWLRKTMAAVEFFGGIGLIVPMAAGVAVVISPVCAVALGLAHIPALVSTLRKGQRPVADSVVLGLAAASAVLGFLIVAGL